MSDIGLKLDGLLALLVAGSLASLLLLAVVVCLAVAWFQARSSGGSLLRQPLFFHVMGMLAATVGFGVIVAIVIARDGNGSTHDLEHWLDRLIPLWVPGILLLWPLLAYTIKPQRSKT